VPRCCTVCCSMLQHVAVCCSVLLCVLQFVAECVAVVCCSSVLKQCVADDRLDYLYTNTLQHSMQHTATLCNTLQHTATHCNTLQHNATHCNTLQRTATHCNTLQQAITRCDTLQHAAICCNRAERHPFSRARKLPCRDPLLQCLRNTQVFWVSFVICRSVLQQSVIVAAVCCSSVLQ